MLSTLTVTNYLDSGPGSLRAEIAAAQNNDTIVFAPSLSGHTITLTSGELSITKGMTIQGPGASKLTVSGNNATTVFYVNSSQPAVLSGLTVSNGRAGVANTYGSALTISGCTISGNTFSGIRNTGTMTVTGCTIAGNSALERNDGRFAGGAGIDNLYGTLTVSNSTIAGNIDSGFYSRGGGVFAAWGTTVALTNCTISNNSVCPNAYHNVDEFEGYGGGGGVYADGGSTVTLTNCTLANNHAVWEGGGLFVNAASPYSPTAVGAKVNVTNCTVSGNSASTFGGGIDVSSGSGFYVGRLTLSNSIVAGNSSVEEPSSASGIDIVSYGVTLAENNLLGNVWGTSTPPPFQNIIINNANPLLGPLQNNGGPTQTMALLPGSLAIGHGDNSKAPATDQRGVKRLDVAGELTDIGAFEL
jgi:hypothetical protein